MRGRDEQQLDVFNISPEQRVPQDYPLRSLRATTDGALRKLQPPFNQLYAKTGRPSIVPGKLLRALYSVRSKRMLMEQLDYNLLFRWFVGLNMDDSVSDVTVFTKNRESDEHFTVDGTPLDAARCSAHHSLCIHVRVLWSRAPRPSPYF